MNYRRNTIMIFVTLGLVVTSVLWIKMLQVSEAQDIEDIQLDAIWEILAGDVWSVQITIPTASLGESAEVVLFNGLNVQQATLELSSGGITEWAIQSGTIVESGTSYLIVTYQGTSIERTLRVLPQEADTLRPLTTTNTLIGYGHARGMLLGMIADRYGNPSINPINVNGLFPDGTEYSETLMPSIGLGWTWFYSQGAAGRVRLVFEIPNGKTDVLEIRQTAAAPAHAMLQLSTNCVLNDGRDKLTLTATVFDVFANPIPNGYRVRFVWDGGEGYGIVLDGQASLQIPVPFDTGLYPFWVEVGAVTSSSRWLSVTPYGC